MKKVNLLTGFLGSGKTTFLKLYANYLLNSGKRIGIIENDYGAVNVDMMLLQDLEGENCTLEMIAGGCDADCHRRHFKTKLIALGMQPFDEVIVEPSGIYDIDEFFDVVREDPLENWYEIGNVYAIVDVTLPHTLSSQSEYLLATQVANAGKIILSKLSDNLEEAAKQAQITIEYINDILVRHKCTPRDTTDFLCKNWAILEKSDWESLKNVGYKIQSIEKEWYVDNGTFSSLYYMNLEISEEKLLQQIHSLFTNSSCGNIHRIKGFFQKETSEWYELNATTTGITFTPIKEGQNVIIVIGENLNEKQIAPYFAP